MRLGSASAIRPRGSRSSSTARRRPSSTALAGPPTATPHLRPRRRSAASRRHRAARGALAAGHRARARLASRGHRADPRVDPPLPLRYARGAGRRRDASSPGVTRAQVSPRQEDRRMAKAAGERVAYFNGRIVPEQDVRVPFRDRGFKYGDAVFDTTRTFGHRIFRLQEHLDRLYRSLRYLRIDPGLSLPELKRITEEVLQKTLPLLEPDDDYWVPQRVTRGLDPGDRATFDQSGPTVIVECLPLPLRERATLYRDGIRVVVPSVRRAPPDSLSARTKTNNYLNVVMGHLEAK